MLKKLSLNVGIRKEKGKTYCSTNTPILIIRKAYFACANKTVQRDGILA